MDALTLWQPWATLVARGYKKLEIRTHRNYAGLLGRRIAIHAGMRWHGSGADMARRYLARRGVGVQEIAELLLAAREERGHVLATARVGDIRAMTREDEDAALCDYDIGDVAYVLGMVVRLAAPVPAKGSQGRWQWHPPLDEEAG